MVLVKVLRRKDASSVVVAIVVAMVIFNMLQTITAKWAAWVAGLHAGQYAAYSYPGTDWKGQYLYPVVFAIIELLVLEVLGWIYVWFVSPLVRK